MPGQTFERDIVHAFNDYFNRTGLKAIAYRHIQMRYQPQLFDVLVDTRGNELYMAIECKSIDPNTVNALYFKKHFAWKGEECQVQREDNWLSMSGRNGWLAVELRRGHGNRTSLFFVPWRVLSYAFNNGAPGLHPEQITYYPEIIKRGGKYNIDEDFITELVKHTDTSGKDVKRYHKKKWGK